MHRSTPQEMMAINDAEGGLWVPWHLPLLLLVPVVPFELISLYIINRFF